MKGQTKGANVSRGIDWLNFFVSLIKFSMMKITLNLMTL
jgi:hypothetical protein